MTLKIALLDLNHMTRGVHTVAVPLGCALIASYLRKNVAEDLDIRMFKDAERLQSSLKEWRPDIAGLAQYTWNSELNLHFARSIRALAPDALIVAGGPNLELETELKAAYLRAHPEVDLCVSFDGEIPMLEIARRTLAGENKDQIKVRPPAGSYALSPRTGELVEIDERPPRLDSLDECGPIYADGVFDVLLDQGFHPFVQTHRGCPFTCTFCHTSDRYYARMIFQSPEVFRQDMEYLGRRFAGQHNVTLYIANTNMSMFEQDFEIAQIIRQCQEDHDWPRIINVNSGKDPDKLLRMLDIIKYQPAIALQTLTPQVLENIHRKNIPFERFNQFQAEVARRTGESSATELILCLPGETKKSFLDTLRKVMNSGIQNIVVYTLMCLKGSPLATRETMQKYGNRVMHRVVPRQFSELVSGDGQGKVKVFDTEEVIIGTSTMSFDDYIDLRGLCFTITAVFSSAELIPLKRLLTESGADVADWLLKVHDKIKDAPGISQNFQAFLSETRGELFTSRERLIEFYSQDKNYQALLDGRLGDNLLRKYKLIALTENFGEVLEIACVVARDMLGAVLGEQEASALMRSLRLFLGTRDMRQALADPESTGERNIHLGHDVPGWLSSTHEEPLRSWPEADYGVALSEYAKERIRDLAELNKDVELSLQMLYRDGTISDLWPTWRSVTVR